MSIMTILLAMASVHMALVLERKFLFQSIEPQLTVHVFSFLAFSQNVVLHIRPITIKPTKCC